MRIRSLKKYVELLTGSTEPVKEHEIGSSSEPLLRRIYGDNTNIDQIITDIASFATDVEEQIFYEFVQNAYDAQANTLLFYANKDYFFVINNGKPFYTDPTNTDTGKPKNGQLFEFLAKNKSAKYRDPNSMGNYGQGSKLLYKLIDEVTLGSEEDSQLQAIKEEKKGPYLLSWHDDAQLTEFLSEHRGWEVQDPKDEKQGLLLAKLIYTYYPVTPSEYPDLFQENEVTAIRTAFDTLVYPRRNMNLFRQGTALIIPLGKGKYEKLIDEGNICKVKERLGGFISLIGEQEENKDRQINRLFVLGKELQVASIKSVFIELKIETENYRYQFAFNESFAEKGKVNFYKYLPISDTKYNLGFLVDCAKFEVDNSRQRIKDTDKTGQQLELAFESLVNKLDEMRITNNADFASIYDAIISTQWFEGKSDEDFAYVMQVFERTLLPFVKQNIRNKAGEYVPMDKVYTSDVEIDVPLKELGIEDKYWIDTNIVDKLSERMGIELDQFKLVDVVQEANKDGLDSWIKSLNNYNYKTIFDNLNQSISKIKDIKFLRSNKGNLFFYNEIVDVNNTLFFVTSNIDSSIYEQDLEIEYIPNKITDITGDMLLDKVEKQAEYLSSTDTLKCVAIRILSNIAAIADGTHATRIQQKIALFKNGLDERKPFKELFADRPTNTALFDNFKVHGFVPETDRNWYHWFLSTPQEQWDWVKRNLYLITNSDTIEWGNCAMRNLQDLKQLATYNEQLTEVDYISINLDEDGNPTADNLIFLKDYKKLNPDEYSEVIKYFEDDNKFIPYQYIDILSLKPFKPQKCLGIFDLISEEHDLPDNIFNLLTKIIEFNGWVKKYRLQKSDNGLTVIPLQQGEQNYFTRYGNSNIYEQLARNGFYNIPDELHSHIQQDEYCAENTQMLTESILNKITDINFLLPIIEHSNSYIKSKYINKLSTIELNTISTNSLEWKILQFAAGANKANEIKVKLRFNGNPIPNSKKSENITIENGQHNPYNLYKLISQYKEDDTQITELLNMIPDEDFFKRNYLEEEELDAKTVFEEIRADELNLYQLQFCLDYAISENVEISLKKKDDISYPQVLDMVIENILNGFDKYLSLPDYDPNIQFYTDDIYLLEDEKLPDYMKKKSELIRPLLSNKYDTDSSKFIKIRKAFLEDTNYNGRNFKDDCDKLHNTIQWFLNQNKGIVYKSEQFKLMNDFILSLPKNKLYLLQYNGDFDNDHPKFQFTEKQSNIFLDKQYLKDLEVFDKSKLAHIFKERQIYFKEGEKVIAHFSIPEFQEIIIERSCDDDKINKEEWNNTVYKKWKKSENLTVYLSSEVFDISIRMVLNKEELHSQSFNNQPYFKKSDDITIQSPDNSQKTVLKLLEQYQEAMKISQEFIRLQSMFLDDTNDVIDIPEDKKKEVQEAIKTNKPLLVDKYGFSKMKDEDLKKLFNNKDKVLKEQIKEPEISAIYGYIGELLYQQYLKQSHLKYEYAAENETKNEYDFTYQDDGKEIYVDVKTTAGSVKEGEAPFYIHKTQYPFMKEHPDYDYRIVRISLKDTGVYEKTKTIKDEYIEQDPRKNDNLKNACQKLAEDYWQVNHDVEEFRKKMHEYKVKVEGKY